MGTLLAFVLLASGYSGVIDADVAGGGIDVTIDTGPIDGVVATFERAQASSIDEDEDGLSKSFESAHNTSDRHKDIFVYVFVGEDYRPLNEIEKRQIRNFWNDMPVSNPDGTDGVRLHFVRQERLSWTPSTGQLYGVKGQRDSGIRSQVYKNHSIGKWECRAHTVILADVESEGIGGYGQAPGHFSVVDGETIKYSSITSNSRILGVNHELLHNVVGKFPDSYENVSDDRYHSLGGALSHSSNVRDYTYTSEPTATVLSNRGFSTAGKSAC